MLSKLPSMTIYCLCNILHPILVYNTSMSLYAIVDIENKLLPSVRTNMTSFSTPTTPLNLDKHLNFNVTNPHCPFCV